MITSNSCPAHAHSDHKIHVFATPVPAKHTAPNRMRQSDWLRVLKWLRRANKRRLHRLLQVRYGIRPEE